MAEKKHTDSFLHWLARMLVCVLSLPVPAIGHLAGFIWNELAVSFRAGRVSSERVHQWIVGDEC